MEYLKHKGEFYRKINLKELGKKELIFLIKEAVEYEPEKTTTIIERISPYYTERYDWWNNGLTLCDSNLNEMNEGDLTILCHNITGDEQYGIS